MKKLIGKSLIIQMIGAMMISLGRGETVFNALAVGYYSAMWSTQLIRWPAIFIMGGMMLISMPYITAAKYIITMLAIGSVMHFIGGDVYTCNTAGKKSSNKRIILSGVMGGLITIVMEMSDIIVAVPYTYTKVILNVASGMLVFSSSVVFAKAMELLMLPAGELTNGKPANEQIMLKGEKIAMFARSLERLAQSVNEFAATNTGVGSADGNVVFEGGELYGGDLEEQYSGKYIDDMTRLMNIWKDKLADSRKAVAAQLNEMSQLLREFSGREYEFERIESERENFLKLKLRNRGVTLKRIALLRNRRGIIEAVVTVKGTKGKVVSLREFIGILEEALGMAMKPMGEYKRIISSETYTYNLIEDTNFVTMNGSAKAVKGSSRISGDNFAFLEMDTGQMLMSLSDGMGSGLKAYRESEMVIELLEELLECGFNEGVALRLINSVFLAGSENINPTTVDMSILDMYSGVCDFVKIGAAATFIKRGGWVEAIKSTSMPMGLFENPDMESTSKKLYDGDFVIMVSDGIIDSMEADDKERRLGEIIMRINSKNPKEMAEQILTEVLKINANMAKDDMTVLVLGVWEKYTGKYAAMSA